LKKIPNEVRILYEAHILNGFASDGDLGPL